MRRVILGLVMVAVFAGVSFAQVPPRVALAVETCSFIPGERAMFIPAIQEYVNYIRANPIDLPGDVFGSFRQVAAPGGGWSFALEVDGLGEFEDFILARAEANASDERRGTLFRAFRSHLDEESCGWSFHLRNANP